jgi:hypothetical protein
MSLSRKEILEHKMIRSETVEVPALGGSVNVRGLKASNVIDMAERFGMKSGDVPILIYGCVDDNGDPLFTESDLPMLLELGCDSIQPLLGAVKRLSGMGADVPKV